MILLVGNFQETVGSGTEYGFVDPARFLTSVNQQNYISDRFKRMMPILFHNPFSILIATVNEILSIVSTTSDHATSALSRLIEMSQLP